MRFRLARKIFPYGIFFIWLTDRILVDDHWRVIFFLRNLFLIKVRLVFTIIANLSTSKLLLIFLLLQLNLDVLQFNAGQPKERVSVSEVHDELLHRLHIDLRGTAQGVDPLEQRTELFQVQVQTKSPTSMIHLFFISNNKNQKVIVLNADPLPMA